MGAQLQMLCRGCKGKGTFVLYSSTGQMTGQSQLCAACRGTGRVGYERAVAEDERIKARSAIGHAEVLLSQVRRKQRSFEESVDTTSQLIASDVGKDADALELVIGMARCTLGEVEP